MQENKQNQPVTEMFKKKKSLQNKIFFAVFLRCCKKQQCLVFSFRVLMLFTLSTKLYHTCFLLFFLFWFP